MRVPVTVHGEERVTLEVNVSDGTDTSHAKLSVSVWGDGWRAETDEAERWEASRLPDDRKPRLLGSLTIPLRAVPAAAHP